MKIGEFLQFGHPESKYENENTSSPTDLLELHFVLFSIFNDLYYILLEFTIV
jgi:hypothetical protein